MQTVGYVPPFWELRPLRHNADFPAWCLPAVWNSVRTQTVILPLSSLTFAQSSHLLSHLVISASQLWQKAWQSWMWFQDLCCTPQLKIWAQEVVFGSLAWSQLVAILYLEFDFIIFLHKLYFQQGAWTHDCAIKTRVLHPLTEPGTPTFFSSLKGWFSAIVFVDLTFQCTVCLWDPGFQVQDIGPYLETHFTCLVYIKSHSRW